MHAQWHKQPPYQTFSKMMKKSTDIFFTSDTNLSNIFKVKSPVNVPRRPQQLWPIAFSERLCTLTRGPRRRDHTPSPTPPLPFRTLLAGKHPSTSPDLAAQMGLPPTSNRSSTSGTLSRSMSDIDTPNPLFWSKRSRSEQGKLSFLLKMCNHDSLVN